MDDQEALKSAQDPNTSEAALEYLAVYSGPDVRRTIAAHPNASLNSMLSLVREFPADVINNPSFARRLLESLPSLRLRDHAPTLFALLDYPALSAGLRSTLFDAIEQLEHKLLLSLMKESILYDGQFDEEDRGLQSRILQHPEYPAERLELFLLGAVPEHRYAASRHPLAPRSLIQSLIALGSSPDLKHYHKESAKPASHETLERFAAYGFWAQYLVAQHPSATSTLLARLAKSPFAGVRCKVSVHENTDAETVQLLSKDTSNVVVASIAGNPNTTPEALSLMLSRNPFSSKIKQSLAGNPSTPEPVLLSLSRNADVFVGGRLAARTRLPEGILFSLMKETPKGNYSLLKSVAESPSLTEKVAALLVKSKSSEVRGALAANPRCPPKALIALCRDKEFNVRCMVVQNGNTPPEALHSLALSRTEEIKAFARAHPNNQSIAMLAEKAAVVGRTLYNELQDRGVSLEPLVQRALMTFEAIAPQLSSTHSSGPVLSSLSESLLQQRAHPLMEYLGVLARSLTQPSEGLPLGLLHSLAVAALVEAGVPHADAVASSSSLLF